MRIWHQSFTDLKSLPGYSGMLAELGRRVCSTGTVVDLHGLLAGTYPEGVAPVDLGGYRWVMQMNEVQVIENCVQAEREIRCRGDQLLCRPRSGTCSQSG
jgi:hypothetical protein